MKSIKELLDAPSQVNKGDFVLTLAADRRKAWGQRKKTHE